MAYLVLPYLVMVYIVMAYVFVACIVMAYIVLADIGMAYIVMAHRVMAYIGYGRYSYGSSGPAVYGAPGCARLPSPTPSQSITRTRW